MKVWRRARVFQQFTISSERRESIMNNNINATTLFNSIDYKSSFDYENSSLVFNRNISFFVHSKPVDSFLRGGGQ